MSGTVRIPISADATSVIDSFDRIRAAVQRAGQDAKSFSQIDFSHPELKGLEAELRRIQANFEGMMRMRSGTAMPIRRAGFNDFLEWFEGRDRISPDPAGLRRHTNNVGRYVLQGTRFQPPPTPSPGMEVKLPPNGPIKEKSDENMSPSMGSGIASMLGGPIKMILGLAGLGKVASMVGQGIRQAEDEATQTDILMRHLRETSQSFDDLRKGAEDASKGLQLTYGESLRLQNLWVGLTNDTHASRVQSNMRFAVGLARGYGIAPEETTNVLGKAAYLGEDERKFAALIGDAVVAGNQTGQVSQVMQALLQWTETSTRQMVTGNSTREFASYYAALNATPGWAGLHGAAGAAALAQVNQTLSQGGGAGMASQVFSYRSLAALGIIDPYEQKFIMSRGMFGTPNEGLRALGIHRHLGAKGDVPLFELERREFSREFGSMPIAMQVEMWSRHFGVSEPVALAMMNMRGADVNRTGTYLRSIGMHLSQVNPSALPEIANIIAPGADLDAERASLIARTGVGSLTREERARLGGESGEALRRDMVELLAKHGMENDTAQRSQQATVDALNSLTKVGEGLLSPLIDLKEGVGKLVGTVGDLTILLTKFYDESFHGHSSTGIGGTVGPDGTVTAPFGIPSMPSVAPGGPGTPRSFLPTKAQQQSVMEQTRKYFLSQGWSDAQVAGILANEGDESSFNPQATNGTHFGLFQWDATRSARFAKMFGHDIQHATVAEQLQFAQWELTHDPHWKRAGDALRKTTTSYDAGSVFSQDYEVAPGGVFTGQYRGEQAAQYATPLPDPGKTSPAPASTVHRIQPLEVVHKNQAGEEIGSEYLPITQISPPVPSGIRLSP